MAALDKTTAFLRLFIFREILNYVEIINVLKCDFRQKKKKKNRFLLRRTSVPLGRYKKLSNLPKQTEHICLYTAGRYRL